MLHKRRSALARGALVVREALLRVEDHLVDADPGLLRLTLAVRSTLSAQVAGIEARLAGLAKGQTMQVPHAPAACHPSVPDAASAGAALNGLDRFLDLLAERLQVSALDGFALLA